MGKLALEDLNNTDTYVIVISNCATAIKSAIGNEEQKSGKREKNKKTTMVE